MAGSDGMPDPGSGKNGPTMMAQIGVMQALKRHVERVFDASRKDAHWGKRKLKRNHNALFSAGHPVRVRPDSWG
jgi:hypothetical protein